MKKRILLFLLMSAIISMCVACGNKAENENEKKMEGFYLAKAVYPERKTMPVESDYKNYNEYFNEYRMWLDEQQKISSFGTDAKSSLSDFTQKSVAIMFQNATEGNVLYSPMNLYMALAILAETADGETREEILTAMSASSIEKVREEAELIWNSNYKDDGYNICLLGNSLWLSDSLKTKQSTAELISKKYYASSFIGTMGTTEYDEALRAWINENTKDLLKEYVKELSMSQDTAFAIASTIYYQGKWKDEFYQGATSKDKFYVNGNKEKSVDVDFMHKTYSDKTVYFGEKFSALAMAVENNGQMWLILPDEGVTPAELSQDKEYLDFMNCNGNWDKLGTYKVELSLPKFDISGKTDLERMMNSLGIEKAWEWGADFTNLIETEDPMRLSKAEQAVRVMIDEKGVKAAAYTVMMTECTSAMPQERELIEFNLNRPFIFNITSSNGTLLFSGVVNNPIEE